MAKYFKGGTFEEQRIDPVNQLIGSGQYRDIPKNIIDPYFRGEKSQEETLAAIRGTPIFNPSGPQINTEQGFKPFTPGQGGQGFNAPGQGFFTPEILGNAAKAIQERLTNISTQIPSEVPSRNVPSAPPIIPTPAGSKELTINTLRDYSAGKTGNLPDAPVAPAIPVAPNLTALSTTSSQAQAYQSTQNDYATSKTDLANFENTILAEQDKIKGQPVATTVINGKLAKLSADTAEAYRQKKKSVSEALDRAQMAQNTLNTYIQTTKEDYNNAVQQYNTSFSQSMQLFLAFGTLTNTNKDNARADFTFLYNVAKDNPNRLKDPNMLAQLKQTALQAGYDTSIVDALANSPIAGKEILSSSWNDGVFSAVVKDPTAPNGMRIVQKGVSGGGNANNITVGTGATSQVEEMGIRTRLFSKLMNIINKGQVSDTDRKIIDERITLFRNAGWSEQKIMDTLSGFAVEVQTPYNSSFRDLIVANTETADDQTQLMGKISLLLNGKNYTTAMETIERRAMDNAKKNDPDNYFGNATTNTIVGRVERIKDLLNQGGVGFVEGNFQNLLGRIKGTNATKVKAELTQLYAQFRQKNAGVNVTESELKFLAPLFADITDTRGNFMTKLSVFENGVIEQHNATRGSVSLPSVQAQDIVNPNMRLRLYGNTENPFSSFAPQGSTSTYSIWNENEGYKIPKGEQIGDLPFKL